MTCITKNNEIQLTLRLQQLKKMLGSLNFLGFSKWGLASWSVFCMDDGMCFNRLFCKKNGLNMLKETLHPVCRISDSQLSAPLGKGTSTWLGTFRTPTWKTFPK